MKNSGRNFGLEHLIFIFEILKQLFRQYYTDVANDTDLSYKQLKIKPNIF